MNDPLEIEPIPGFVNALVTVPGSKSITNRALLIAASATGETELSGVLFADDTVAMVGALEALGAVLDVNEARRQIRVRRGIDWDRVPAGVSLDAIESGTSSRFLVAAAALGEVPIIVDGRPSIRVRPIGDLVDALRHLGATVRTASAADTVSETGDSDGSNPSLPLSVDGAGMSGGTVSLRGDASSQFLSALMMIGPHLIDGLRIELTTPLVSRPYVVMTAAVMESFGATATLTGSERVQVDAGHYNAANYRIEPDASAASYFFAAAAVCGGRVRIDGLGTNSLQGDLRFVELLGEMGADVTIADDYSEVVRRGPLHGIEADLADCSDIAPTIAVVAGTAVGESRFTGIGFIRRKESDRVGGVVAELQRCGVEANEEPDGFTIVPRPIRAATFETYGDHRMAMSFAILGLAHPGMRIAGPECVAKTYPDFFEDLDQLRPNT